MKREKKIDSKEAGLEIALHFFKFFLKSEYLHYGLFTKDLKTDILNLTKAQENYADFLISQIPSGVNSILDVGCGSGKMAQTLINKGYKVDCVSPGNLLTNYVKNLLGDKIELYNCKFQDLQTAQKYDLILFSESFQYIPIKSALDGFLEHSTPKGYIIISDFFQTDAPGKSPLGGGHKFSEWEEIIKQYPLKKHKEQDITKETAPTIDLVQALSQEVLFPISEVISLLAEDRFPLIIKFIKWKYKKKLKKLGNKHLKGDRNAENFIKYKKYMFYVFQKDEQESYIRSQHLLDKI